MGEDLPGIGAIRNMMDPTLFGDPGQDERSASSSASDSADRRRRSPHQQRCAEPRLRADGGRRHLQRLHGHGHRPHQGRQDPVPRADPVPDLGLRTSSTTTTRSSSPARTWSAPPASPPPTAPRSEGAGRGRDGRDSGPARPTRRRCRPSARRAGAKTLVYDNFEAGLGTGPICPAASGSTSWTNGARRLRDFATSGMHSCGPTTVDVGRVHRPE